MYHTSLAWAGLAAVTVCCVFAVIAGSWRERLAGLVYLGAYGLQYVAAHYLPLPHAWRYLVPDLACLLVFFSLCWKAPHPWPLWASGFQMVSVMVEVTSITHHLQVELRTFLTLEMISGYTVLATLLTGTVAAIRARQKTRKSV